MDKLWQQQSRGLPGNRGSSWGGEDEGEDRHSRGRAMLTLPSLKAPAPLTRSKAAPGRRAGGAGTLLTPTPQRNPCLHVFPPYFLCTAHGNKFIDNRHRADRGWEHSAVAEGRRDRTGTIAGQYKRNARPPKAQHRKPHLKFSAGRDGVKVFPCVKRGWLAGTVLAGMALFWSVERGSFMSGLRMSQLQGQRSSCKRHARVKEDHFEPKHQT